MIPLLNLKGWKFDKKKIFDTKNFFFSIIGLKIFSNSREVTQWEQPIIKEKTIGLSGFIVKKKNDTYHF